MAGWIKLYRKLWEKGYYKKSEYVHLWVHILLKANHGENEFFWNGANMVINPGEFITGRDKLSDETGINSSKIERILKTLENEQQIEQQKTTKFRIIRVINWQIYQNKENGEQQNEQQVNNKRTTSEQQVNTNKNDKNDKKVKEVKHKYGEYKNVLLTDEQVDKLKTKLTSRYDHWIEKFSKGIKMKTYGYKDHYLAILSWVKREDKSDDKKEFQKNSGGSFDVIE